METVTNVTKIYDLILEHLRSMPVGNSLYHSNFVNGNFSAYCLIKRKGSISEYFEGWENGDLVEDKMPLLQAINWFLGW